jgi:hypothetical protein
VQLAAVLQGATVSADETRANRLWGGVGLIGGALELVGSAALLADPDPTVSKGFGYLGVVHGSDVVATSWRQLVTGQSQTTNTAQAAAALAEMLGVPPDKAATVGVIVDIAVPIGVAAGLARAQRLTQLARIGKINKGYISLADDAAGFDEAHLGTKAASHAIRDHVGKSFADLVKRFAQKPSTLATSSFASTADAEEAVSMVLRANRAKIVAWVRDSATSKPLTLFYEFKKPVGYGVVNAAKFPGLAAAGSQVPVKFATVVLNKTSLNGRVWYVLTAFPDTLRELGLI